MKVKAESCVFFVDKMAPEEEYEIVSRHAPKPQRRPAGKLNGSRVLLTGHKLFVQRHIGVVDLEYVESDEKIFNLLVCLTRLPPFYNFVLNFKERGQDIGRCHIMDRISRILGLMVEGRRGDASDLLMEPDSKRYEGIYSELLRAIHNELTEWYNFEEDVWSTMDKGQGTKTKPLYRDYSPIVEMFQGKVLFNQQEASFEKGDISLKGFSSVQRAFDSWLENEKKITKVPAVLVLVVKEQGNLNLLGNTGIDVAGHSFSLYSFITERDTVSCCYVKDGDHWYGYESDGVRGVSRMEEIRGHPLMLFYARSG
ncbi:hypothetical protein [Encephalitozoon cuniculi GB-M1]|uniref:USP domain-containing protein n=2 Tax=Encephalitozoon cuniculi TaxID=6035 RepID=Q8SU61_ENCCU|nr:uncharacterized protein ECU11_0600 [Encephalitozoon cuniculi GB-M1]AGE94924.1 hypothetical protein ECU11_0600 [Encephalitozoon cuniculi]KMV65017.1 hypothetical protein M970_110580 [Encephalitozoon cuniculi EcunIII-L]UYI26262.1 ubiquitin carboxyl-terminal hydrolase 28 [Encephalitozoon cuniculi]CAD25970.1 hypothetical protein [Encephalitozoon cuniculi GB-M1]